MSSFIKEIKTKKLIYISTCVCVRMYLIYKNKPTKQIYKRIFYLTISKAIQIFKRFMLHFLKRQGCIATMEELKQTIAEVILLEGNLIICIKV